jgi:perosamine synthetase
VKIDMAMADIDETDVQAVTDVVRSKRLALGSKNLEFEQMVCEKFGVKHAITVNSGTSALHLIVKSLGISPGDEVLVPSFTFVASVNAILFEGATPVFVDIDPETYNFCVTDAEKKITKKTKAMMVVDVFGHPADWKAITALSKKHNLKVIDDCCEAIGAKFDGKWIGGFGDAGTFAFYPNKQMTTGEGGMVVTNDDKIAELCRVYRNQGRGAMSAWLEHDSLGFNYRMDEMSAALGCTQFAKIDKMLANREAVAHKYLNLLESYPQIKTQIVRSNVKMSWFVFVVTLPHGCDRDSVMKELDTQEIPSRAYFSPVHEQKYFHKMIKPFDAHLPVTMDVSARTVALPFHGMMTDEEVQFVVKNLVAAVEKYSSKKKAA